MASEQHRRRRRWRRRRSTTTCSASAPPHLTTRSARHTTSRSPLNPFQPSYLARLMLLLLSFSHQKQQMPFGSCLFGKLFVCVLIPFLCSGEAGASRQESQRPAGGREVPGPHCSLIHSCWTATRFSGVNVWCADKLRFSPPSGWFPGSWRGLPGSERPSAEEGL